MKIPTYVHTVNSEDEVREFAGTYGVSNVYSDFLPPS